MGLMSGTSLDGLDIALCTIKGSGKETKVDIEQFKTSTYAEEFKERMRKVFAKKNVDLETLTLLHGAIAQEHANLVLAALAEWNIAPSEVDVLASHGQTVYHAPAHFHQQGYFGNATLQLGDGDHLAVKTGIFTLSDFRQKHIAFGGEGAPLVPYGDYLLYSSSAEHRILLNLGGIANFTYLAMNGQSEDVLASDLGPANTLIDQLVKKEFGQDYDKGGTLAQLGRVNHALLEALMQLPFIGAALPKSTGPELFNLEIVKELAAQHAAHISAIDLLATLTYFTASAISQQLGPFIKENTSLYCSGGGVHNTHLMSLLQQAIPNTPIKTVENLGIRSEAKEAVLFAVLANETLVGTPFALGAMPALSMGKLSFPS
ncbi:MAG: anhydro-N-acetylmuramic acid kinase [Sphingobacteriaceae bacterium]